MGKRFPFALCNSHIGMVAKELRLLVAVSLPEEGKGRWVIAFYSWAFGWLWLRGLAHVGWLALHPQEGKCRWALAVWQVQGLRAWLQGSIGD